MPGHVLQQPPVVSVLFDMLPVPELHVARRVCQLWQHEADRRLRRTTLHWDYWEDEPPPPAGADPQLSRMTAFLARTLAACPFQPGHVLLFAGSTRRSECQALLPTACRFLRQHAAGISVLAFDAHSINFENCRVIGTPLASGAAVRKNFRYANAACLGVLLLAAGGAEVRAVTLHEERDRAAALAELAAAPQPRAVLLLCAGYTLYRCGQRLLLELLSGCGAHVALGGGVSSGPGLFPGRAPLGLVTVAGGRVRAVSRVLHGARDTARATEFVEQLRRLDFPTRHTVALVFANCVHRESHYTDVECRLFQRAFPSVPVFGWGTVRQVGHESGRPHRKHARINPYAMNRSVVFVLLHIPPE
ncbi:F-box only protein 22-like [Pollicipes pollicipes]|uniref:F-box only protein 22-like n=1 Tax=Pollicipes pollicipes TaxID=41117 RepID=UPI0018858825|nr:F-box only protein 22-like [Pollicipes pollicipes]XP_037090121.1 F-box only protein 22-like [Pollicipes pollicipes]XP_037090122.1 F-box only protein 22-like [Pollicipes pollicipes]XP_037090123.1 F-box only protein 22-like [Pollicipes pollicipes]XP_037090124.1 F-box only protein 22-like [Pollicipes pollicipes]XP_037090125.1 F-box only protein 22-like [Pollicipes pollicipes]XP_037090127.1 F-box only protein 22-like [Pollicipes pollicipes]